MAQQVKALVTKPDNTNFELPDPQDRRKNLTVLKYHSQHDTEYVSVI